MLRWPSVDCILLKGKEVLNSRLKILIFRTQFRAECPKLRRGDVTRDDSGHQLALGLGSRSQMTSIDRV
jgi:hypothetical protein